jgi:hypothetical protein
MPPQQAYGLLDFVDEHFRLCAHGSQIPSVRLDDRRGT